MYIKKNIGISKNKKTNHIILKNNNYGFEEICLSDDIYPDIIFRTNESIDIREAFQGPVKDFFKIIKDTKFLGIYGVKTVKYLSLLNELIQCETLEILNVGIKSLKQLPPNLKTLKITSFNKIVGINHISYFPKSLERITFQDLFHLKSIPELPNSLKFFKCKGGKLVRINSFPLNLEELEISYNKLVDVPPFPSSLKKINLFQNDLESLPELPLNLTELNCGGNRLSSLPDIPNKLKNLDCCGNKLNKLPSLPNSLKVLKIQNNKFIKFPVLPDNLEKLYCLSNNIKIIKKFPKSLKVLDIANNKKIKQLPPLPKSLRHLSCYHNSIEILPELPHTLIELDCEFNQIKKLPPSLLFCRNLRTIYFYHNEIELTLPQIRFIENIRNRTQLKKNGKIYDDSQNIHNSAVQKSLLESINILFSQ